MKTQNAPFGAAYEQRRQNAVDAVRQNTSDREGELQRIVEQAAAIAQTPIASVSIIDRDRQWIAAGVGINVSETPRSSSICNWAILRPGEPLIIFDTHRDERYMQIPVVSMPPFIRFYAGIALINRAGYALGALCVVDIMPRTRPPNLVSLGRLARDAERVITGP